VSSSYSSQWLSRQLVAMSLNQERDVDLVRREGRAEARMNVARQHESQHQRLRLCTALLIVSGGDASECDILEAATTESY
jgi:hypothetical protein